MPRNEKLPDNWRDILRTSLSAVQKKELSARVAQAERIPEDAKTTMTMYISVRHAEMLKVIAEVTRVSTQDLLRDGVEHVLSEYEDIVKPKRKRA